MSKAYLILENGAVFEGEVFGYETQTVGELVFTTGMSGFLETLSDPCFSGQAVVQTFPLVGNYGFISDELDSDTVYPKAYIVREWCQEPSNFRSEGELDTFLRRNKVPGLSGVDTRALTRIIRRNGVMKAVITNKTELDNEILEIMNSYKMPIAENNDLKERVMTANGKFKIALLDLGCRNSFTDGLIKRGIDVTAVPPHTDLSGSRFDGVIISDGPGNPAENVRTIETVKKLFSGNMPILGAGLGHQIMAISAGAKTEKLPFGHRGANQPVRDTESGRVFITGQNHGYTVVSLPEGMKMRYENCNDGTCEGIDYSDKKAFSVQYIADETVFERFIKMMEGGSVNAAE